VGARGQGQGERPWRKEDKRQTLRDQIEYIKVQALFSVLLSPTGEKKSWNAKEQPQPSCCCRCCSWYCCSSKKQLQTKHQQCREPSCSCCCYCCLLATRAHLSSCVGWTAEKDWMPEVHCSVSSRQLLHCYSSFLPTATSPPPPLFGQPKMLLPCWCFPPLFCVFCFPPAPPLSQSQNLMLHDQAVHVPACWFDD